MAPSLETSSLPGVVPASDLPQKEHVSVSVSSVPEAVEQPALPKFEVEDRAIDDVPPLKVRYVAPTASILCLPH